jgi:4-hydroxybenzoate polyprenyltransferase
MELKELVKKIFDPFVYSQLYISFGAVGFMLFTVLVYNLTNSAPLAIILFSEFFFIYSLNRLTDLEEDALDKPHRSGYIKSYKCLFSVSMILLTLSIIYSFFHSAELLAVIFFSFFLGFVYSAELPTGIKTVCGYKRLKEVLYLKNTVVAFVWALIPISTLLYFGIRPDALAFLISLFLFLRILIGAIAFDVRDMRGDINCGIVTFPIKFGIKKTKTLLQILNIFSIIPILCGVLCFGISPVVCLPPFLILFYGMISIDQLTKTKDLHFLTDVVIDGEYIILGLCSLILILI